MAFLDDLGKKITVTGKNVLTKAKGMVDISDLKNQISGEERKLTSYYQNLGHMYYELKKDEPLPELTQLVEMINSTNKQIEDIKAQITAIETKRTCPVCGNVIEDDMAFCVGCGTRIEKPVMPNQMQGQPGWGQNPGAEGQPRFCVKCGYQLLPGAVFCTRCGTKQG